MSNPKNVAIIGYGNAGRSFHAYLIGQTLGLKLVGIASRDASTRQRIEQDQNVRAYDSFEQTLADPAVDLVVIATPHDTHAPYATAALRAGKNVVVEKVICLNRDEFEQLQSAQTSSGKLLTVFHNRRFDGDWKTVCALRDRGELGEIQWAEMAWNRHGPWRGWRGVRDRGGGRLYDLGAHLLDQMLLLFPQPVVGVCASIQRKWPGFDVESQSMLTLHFEGGGVGIIDTGCMTSYQKPRFHIVATKATFVKFGVDPQEEAMKAGNIDAAREPAELYGKLYTDEGERLIPTIPGRWRNLYENVAAVLSGQAQPIVTLDQMRRLIGVLDAAFESERTGRMIRPRA